MKRINRWLALLLLAVLAAGCKTERPDAVLETPWDDLPKLERIAQDYAKAHKVAFDFAHTQAEAGTKEATDIAFVYFYHDKSQPYFRCKIDREGQVLEAGIMEPASLNRRARPYESATTSPQPEAAGAKVESGNSASNAVQPPPRPQPEAASATQASPPEAAPGGPPPGTAPLTDTGAWRGDAHLDSLRVGSVTYTNVTVTTVLTEDVFFRHDGGDGHAKLKELDPELQKRLAHSTFSVERRFAEYNCAITIPSGYQGTRLDFGGGLTFAGAYRKNNGSRTVGLIMLDENYKGEIHKGDADENFATSVERRLKYDSFEVEASLPGRYLLVGGLRGYEHVILLRDPKNRQVAMVIRWVAAEGRVYQLMGMMPNVSIETPGNDPEIMATLDSFRFLQAPAPQLVTAGMDANPRTTGSKPLSSIHKIGIFFYWGLAFAFVACYWFICHCLKLICEKSGETPGVLIYIPILNLFPLLRAARMSRLLIVLFLIPGVGLITAIVMCVRICQSCGKSGWLAVLAFFPGPNLFLLAYLAFSK